jgi:cation:H+ antiporter
MFADLSLPLLVLIFLAAAGLITLCGIRMTSLADRLADRTGWGEALIGGVLLGAATSVSGIVVTATAALNGEPSLAFSNGVGGIAAQTAFLALADLLHRRVNLEHAAADLANVFQGAVLLLLLSLPLIAFTGPDVTFWAIHPISVVLVGLYLLGLVAARQVREEPMWRPIKTRETEPDEPDETEADDEGPTSRVVTLFVALTLAMGVAGWTIAQIAGVLIGRYDLNASMVGALMTAVATSLPELVTTLAAVRRGALQLAVGGIIGGNTFDALFLTVADAGYRDGSIYHAVERSDYFWLATGLVMTAILTLGQLYRQKEGPGGIGLESVLLIVVWLGAALVQALG